MNTAMPYSTNGIEAFSTGLNSVNAFNFSLVYKQYAQKVYRKCLSMLREEAIAEDVTQEVFLIEFFRSEGRV